MNPETRAEAAAWLAKARIDLRAARADLNASPPITSDTVPLPAGGRESVERVPGREGKTASKDP